MLGRLLALTSVVVAAGVVAPVAAPAHDTDRQALAAAQPWPQSVLPSTMLRRLPRPVPIDAPVVPVRMEGSVLTPPSDPDVLGRWWGPHHTRVLIGHTVHTGGGVLEHLDRFKRDDRIRVDGHVWLVRANRMLSKARVARAATRLFSSNRPGVLVMVTCSNYDWSTGVYRTNTVLRAVAD